MKKVLIIGAGASGLSAAVTALRTGHQVTVLEKKEQPGKKLSLTGNGRCNFTNRAMGPAYYRGHDMAFTARVLERFSTEDVVLFMQGLGMLQTERNGYFYPANLKAQTVVNALVSEVKSLGGEILTGVNVTSLKKENDGRFKVYTSRGEFTGDAVILACGSEASVKDPNAFTAYDILKNAGHHLYTVKPVLVPLYGNEGYEKLWDGIRITASVSFENHQETGELQLTKEGISGIPVFQLSHEVQEKLASEKKAAVTIDFLPEFSEEELFDFLTEAPGNGGITEKSIEDLLKLWIPQKIVPVMLKKAQIRPSEKISDISAEKKKDLLKGLKSFSYKVIGAGDLSRAQSVSGGVDLKEVRGTMESGKMPGLYITGELLDTDGLCGGYNLHFAFATGIIAGGSL